MTHWLKRSALILLVVGVSGTFTPAEAKRKTVPQHTVEERMQVFAEVFAALDQGDQNTAAEQLLVIINNSENEYYHVDAYAQLGGILEKMSMPYSALLAYEKGLSIDASRIPSIAEKSIKLADELGDSEILESIFASNLKLEVSPEIRSRMSYLAARSAFSKGELGPAMGILMMVQPTDPDYPEAQNLLGVIYSQQGRHEDAIKPLQTAYKEGLAANKPAKLQDAALMNMARAYFAAQNYPQASVYYNQVPRPSIYWLDAQFERGWSHFHMGDMNGVLGLLHTLQSPFFQDETFAEAELLRIYGMVMLCKFNEANNGIDQFPVRFGPQQETLAAFAAKNPEELFDLVRSEVNGQRTQLPYSVSRRYVQEDRMLDAIKSVSAAESEAARIKALDGSQLATAVTEWVSARKIAIIRTEGVRIQQDLQQQAQNLKNQMVSLEISKLDILDMEGQMLNRAAETGKMEEARRQVKREKRIKSSELVWEYQGEYWADELGYYRLNTKSECPASLSQ